MAKSEALRLEREKRKTAREERFWSLIDTPTNKRLLSLALVIAATGALIQMKDKGPSGTALASGLPGIGLPLIAADAGITSWEALLAIGLAGGSIQYLPTLTDLASGETTKEFGTKTLGLSGWLTGQGYLPAP